MAYVLTDLFQPYQPVTWAPTPLIYENHSQNVDSLPYNDALSPHYEVETVQFFNPFWWWFGLPLILFTLLLLSLLWWSRSS